MEAGAVGGGGCKSPPEALVGRDLAALVGRDLAALVGRWYAEAVRVLAALPGRDPRAEDCALLSLLVSTLLTAIACASSKPSSMMALTV